MIARRNGFTRRGPKATLAPDLVERDFTAKVPNRLSVTDLTMTPTDEGPCGSPRSVMRFTPCGAPGETSASADADLVLTTLEYVLVSREVEHGKLIPHADHGCLVRQCFRRELVDADQDGVERLGWLSPIEFEEKHYTKQATV
ncbi:hypothetical protein [Streptomyces sp. NPDC058695]|uniref:hypothetical protein n=1 Tax=Streptomyces sp. NPDC058695 TaxID=3346604 RepID=UPI003660738B